MIRIEWLSELLLAFRTTRAKVSFKDPSDANDPLIVSYHQMMQFIQLEASRMKLIRVKYLEKKFYYNW